MQPTQLYTLDCPYPEIKVQTRIIPLVLTGMRPARPSSTAASGASMSDAMWELVKQCWGPYDSRPHIDEIADRLAQRSSLATPPSGV